MKKNCFSGLKGSLLIVAAMGAALLTGCGEAKFKVDGSVYGAEGMSVVLEKADYNGRWVAVDSAKVSGSGNFSISSVAPASPEIYRLSLGDRFIYFPVDSVETVHIESSEKEFGHKFTLSGTPQAERLGRFEQDLLSLQNPDSAAFASFKRDVYTKYIKDGQGSILGYYVLTKVYDGKPLYNPEDPEDAKYYAAVATQFDNFRPDDPHGKMVKAVSIQAMRNRNALQGKKTVLQAREVSVLDIALQDENGKEVCLSDVVGKGKKVALIFGMMNEAESPVFNQQLSRLYSSKGGSVEFYHVSFDTDHYAWRDAARNLPWITVIDPAGMSSEAARDYNLSTLPAIFIYDASGELVDRADSFNDLSSKL